MMELFTLGADRGAYTEHDVREQARSLTGWQNSWKPGLGDYDFHFDPTQHDDRHEDGVPQARPLRLAGRLQALRRAPAARRRSSWRSSGRTSSRRRRTTRRRPALEALYRSGYAGAGRSCRRSSSIRSSTTARGWSSRRSCTSPGCCAASAPGSRRPTGPGSGRSPGQQLFYPPNVAGWDDTRWLDTATFRGRWIAVAADPPGPQARPAKGKRAAGRRDRSPRARSRSGTSRRSPSATHAALMHFARAALADAGKDDWKQQQYPVLVENALRQLIAVSPELQTVMTTRNVVCDECTRADALRAVAGRGLPSIEPGMPTPAGTGLTRRSFVARSLGLALSVYGAGRLQLFDEGIAARRDRRRRSPCSSSVFLQGGADALSLLYPDGDPLYRKLRTDLALDGRHAVHRGHAADLAPGARAARAAVRRGQGHRAAGGRLRPPRPVALHLPPLLGGRGDRPAAADRLDRPLSRRRRDARQPAAGPLDHRLAAADARDGQGAGRRDRRAEPVRLLGPGRVGRASRRGCSTRSGTLGRVRSQRSRRAHRRRTSPRRPTRCAASCCRSRQQGALDPAGRLPDRRTTRSRRACRASRRWSRPACRCAASRSRRRARTTRTPGRPLRSRPP